MIDLAFLRDNPDAVRRGAARKRIAFDVDRALALDAERRRLTTARESVKAEQNRIGKQIAMLAGEAKQEALARSKSLKEEVERQGRELAPVEAELATLMLLGAQPARGRRAGRRDGRRQRRGASPRDAADVRVRAEGPRRSDGGAAAGTTSTARGASPAAAATSSRATPSSSSSRSSGSAST